MWLLHVLSPNQTAAAPPLPSLGCFPNPISLIFCVSRSYRSRLFCGWGLWEVCWVRTCLVLPNVLAALWVLCCWDEWDEDFKVHSLMGFQHLCKASGSSGRQQLAHVSSVTSRSASSLPLGMTCFPGFSLMLPTHDVRWLLSLVGLAFGLGFVSLVPLCQKSLQWLHVNAGRFWGLERNKYVNTCNIPAPLQTTKPWTRGFYMLIPDC